MTLIETTTGNGDDTTDRGFATATAAETPTLFLSLPVAARAAAELNTAIDRARECLLGKQNPAGYWVGELEGDSILESEYLLLKFILGQDDDPQLPKITNYLRRQQAEHGGWAIYPGGPPELSATVKAYFCLKLMGDDPAAPHMRRAREVILSMGGAGACNSFSKFYLAALGQMDYDECPAIPPEIVWLPKWAYFNLYNVSAWTRTMILPLSFVVTLRPVRKLPEAMGIAELFVPRPPFGHGMRGWKRAFIVADRCIKRVERNPLARRLMAPLRRASMRKAEEWLLKHLDNSEGLGAIFPPMVYILIVFKALGYPEDHPRVVAGHRHLRDFLIEEGDAIRIQPCLSPVWDTGIALHALAETGLEPGSGPARRATDWLLAKECRQPADWCVNCPGVEPSGWFFEFENPHYPDVDDTAMVTMSLTRVGGELAEPAAVRGEKWILAMQNEDGGWAAFDRTRDRPILEHIPFADHNAMQDPSCPDIAGRVLECLGHRGLTIDHPPVKRAIQFIRTRQEVEGCWFGRWGVNYVYGTWQVLAGLRAVGEDMNAGYVRRAADWLRSSQKPDGSWGESCATYDDPSLKGQGASTASQTAWGLMGLLAVAGPDEPAVQRAVRWLVEHQTSDGNWDESTWTGTGFPKVFYLKYHLYRLYFPLMALARYRRLAAGK